MNIQKDPFRPDYPTYYAINSFFNRDKSEQLTIGEFLCYNKLVLVLPFD